MHKSLIWDIYTRIFHWLLVVCIGLQWLTADLGGDWLQWHARIGYVTLALIVFRIIWGIAGTTYARFISFLPRPKAIKEHLQGKKTVYLSHNPVGAIMVFALILIILAQGISGLFTTDDIFFDGPLRGLLGSEWQQLADSIHHESFSLLKVLVALHIAAAFYYLWVKKQNLIVPMITGYKRTGKDESITSQYHVRAWLIMLLVAALITFIVQYLPPDVSEYDYY